MRPLPRLSIRAARAALALALLAAPPLAAQAVPNASGAAPAVPNVPPAEPAAAFQPPAPGGPYAVGSRWLPLADSARVDSLAPAPGPRQLLVRLWYPAERVPAGARPMPLWPGGLRFARALSAGLGAPPTLLDAAAAVPSHSYADAPVARRGRPFPVVLFSHGYGQGFESQNSAQMEELASRGYVVASIDHPYEVAAVVYPDGGPVLAGNVAQIRRLSGELDSTTIAAVARAAGATDSAARVAAVRDILARTPTGQASVARWTADTRFVLDELARRNTRGTTRDTTRGGSAPWPLAGALDLTRLGVMGMSFGGAVAGDFCATDARCTAGVNLDGLQFGAVLDHPIARPMLFAASDQPGVTGVNDFAYLATQAPAYRLVVRGSHHLNYTDFSLLAPVVRLPGVLGPVDPARMEAIVSAYVVAFFDRHLKRAAAPLLDQRPSPFSEADFRARAPGARER